MMMKKLQVKLFVLAAVNLGSQATAHAANPKKDYCNNQDFYTSTGADEGKIYPHLHCMKTGLTFSASSSNHKNFLQGDTLNEGQANGACSTPNIGLIKGVIRNVCNDYGKQCRECN
jgi:hypothetical protein